MSTPTPATTAWICAQIGAREHYAVPRILAGQGKLERLLTDYWWPAPWPLPPRPAGRHHHQLRHNRVEHLNLRALLRDGAGLAASRASDWAAISARNQWFQRAHLARLQRQRRQLRRLAPGIFFAYSYAARDLLAFFRDLGWHTVLGQIDGGPEDARIIAGETAACSYSSGHWRVPPECYWNNLRREHALADRVLVNSPWSHQLCRRAGLPVDKLRIVPLAYDEGPATGPIQRPGRHYPERFDRRRPLRVLFLGQISVRKGIHHLLDSLLELGDEPIELSLVGPGEMQLPEALHNDPRIVLTGAVPRSRVGDYYSRADVFILPTPSDGFALTQLEAQARGLPVLATRYCGEVVRDGVNGLIIEPLSSASISACLRRCLQEPGLLARLAAASRIAPEFTLESLTAHLTALENELIGEGGQALPPATSGHR